MRTLAAVCVVVFAVPAFPCEPLSSADIAKLVRVEVKPVSEGKVLLTLRHDFAKPAEVLTVSGALWASPVTREKELEVKLTPDARVAALKVVFTMEWSGCGAHKEKFQATVKLKPLAATVGVSP